MQKTIAFFDFDGTITTKDTMLELIKFSKGKGAYYIGMAILSPVLIAMKSGLLSKAKAKEKMLAYFFGGTPINEFDITCKQFADTYLPALIRPAAMVKIQEHIAKGIEVVVVSASAENWIRNWCVQNNLKYLSTKLQIHNNKITGRLSGANCNGEEKVNRIKSEYDLSAYSEIYCYGDTKGDKPMLQLATFASYKPFRS